jgi:uncharacterized protein YukE
MALVKNEPPSVKQDLNTIQTLLQQVRNYARENRYGGWFEKWEQATTAIKALDRIEKELIKKQQMQLL